MKKSIVAEKSFEFALKIIDLYKILIENNEYVLSKQLLKSGTSIGANVQEALAAVSTKDFVNKMAIASKEARETDYWLSLLEKSGFVDYDYSHCIDACDQLVKMLTAIVKTANNSKLKTKN